MIITKLSIKGFKSYGNNEQSIELSQDKGELILLYGENGAGKSALINSFDYVLYGKVRGKKKRWATLSSLANRFNKEMLVSIEFLSGKDQICVKRGQNPSILELSENGVLDDQAGKVNINDKIEKIVDMDIETFKSFISMSINDFKNFMSLSNEEKKLLLDKLFNLEVLNQLNDILKSITKDTNKQINSIDSQLAVLDKGVIQLKMNIAKAKEKAKENKLLEYKEEEKNIIASMEKISEDIKIWKKPWDDIKVKKEELSNKEAKINDIERKLRKDEIDLKSRLKTLKNELSLYENNKCPKCGSDLTTGIHQEVHEGLIKNVALCNESIEALDEKWNKFNESKTKWKQSLTDVNNEYTKVHSQLNMLKRDGNMLKENLNSIKYKIDKIDTNENWDEQIEDFIKQVDDMLEEKETKEITLNTLQDESSFQKELSKVLSGDGIKKMVVSSLIDPINDFLLDNLSELGIKYEVELDSEFNATIRENDVEIDLETLSTGETKLINIAILLAYTKVIRLKRNINILFLDEVFASIDLNNINYVISLLKKISYENKINIFLVHHAMLEQTIFDRIINVTKDVFTNIKEV